MLTAVLPTRNRSAYCASQLRFLRDNGFEHSIIVLDASDADQAEAVRASCVNVAEYQSFDPTYRLVDKLATVISLVETPYVVLVPDDDILLPEAIAAALAFLRAQPDYVVAHGYFLSFGLENNDFDIFRVNGFTPSIDADAPLERHYHLLRRYQSFYWGVFRTDVFSAAVTAARAMNVVLFRELTVMSTSVLQGKVARLPMVYALRGTAPSHAAIHNSHPLFWFLRDAESFFTDYLVFRNAMARFIRARGIGAPPGTKLEQLLDIAHATYLGRELDLGMANYTARLLLGADIPPLRMDSDWIVRGQTFADDVTHDSNVPGRRYIWRRSVVEAEPRHEIAIDANEMARVERQLDAYSLSGTGNEVGPTGAQAV